MTTEGNIKKTCSFVVSNVAADVPMLDIGRSYSGTFDYEVLVHTNMELAMLKHMQSLTPGNIYY